MIKITVIIPVYNTPQVLLEQCLDSIRDNMQDVDKIEVLLINDGSTTPYIEPMLKAAETADTRIKYLFKSNSGVSETRNMGIEMAQGEYITFVDADDTISPHAFSYMAEVIDHVHPEIAVFGIDNDKCKHDALYTISKSLTPEEICDAIIAISSGDEDGFAVNNIYWNVPSARLYQTRLIKENNISFLPYLVVGEDSVFNLCCLSKANNVYLDNTITYHYVLNQLSITNITSPARLKNIPLFMQSIEVSATHKQLDRDALSHAIGRKFLCELRCARQFYLTHPDNQKSFWELKSELNAILTHPIVKKCIKNLQLSQAQDNIERKNIILLKLRLYWIYLITERRKRRLKKGI